MDVLAQEFADVFQDPKEGGAIDLTPPSSGVVPPPPSPAEALELHSSPPPPALPSSSAPSDALIYAREAQLEAREADVARRERDVDNKERMIRRTSNIVPLKNWPALCPLTYHSLDEIPIQDQSLVRTAYRLWVLTASCYVVNLLVMTTLWLGGGPRGLWETLMSALVVVAGVPLSFILWYKGGIYSACKTDGTLRFGWFLFHFSMHTFWMAWGTLAVPSAGEYLAGLFTAIDCFRTSVFFGIISMLATALWLACALLSLHVMRISVHRFRGGARPREEMLHRAPARI